jgi:hypothetical protein
MPANSTIRKPANGPEARAEDWGADLSSTLFSRCCFSVDEGKKGDLPHQWIAALRSECAQNYKEEHFLRQTGFNIRGRCGAT